MTTVTPSLESIQEVAVLTNNFQAEYGIRAGVVVNIVTKSGTDNWHGTAWDYIRSEALNATPWSDAFRLPDIPNDGMGSRNYLWSPGTFSNDVNISKQFPISEGKGLELRASLFNPFNQARRQDLNTGLTYKMKGPKISDGYTLFNAPQTLLDNLVSRTPNGTEAEKCNQYRSGAGHSNVTSVLDMRRIEIGLRFMF